MFDVIQEMAASRCSVRRNFVCLSIKICRNSSTLTGTASKDIRCSTSVRDNKIEIPFKLPLVLCIVRRIDNEVVFFISLVVLYISDIFTSPAGLDSQDFSQLILYTRKAFLSTTVLPFLTFFSIKIYY